MQPQVAKCRDDMCVHVLLVADVGSRTQSWLRGVFNPVFKKLLDRLFSWRRLEAILQLGQNTIELVLHVPFCGAIELPTHTFAATKSDADRGGPTSIGSFVDRAFASASSTRFRHRYITPFGETVRSSIQSISFFRGIRIAVPMRITGISPFSAISYTLVRLSDINFDASATRRSSGSFCV